MKRNTFYFLLSLFLMSAFCVNAQMRYKVKLQDTGELTGYTATHGEDADYIINPPSFTDNGDGTITDNNTGLMWQKADGGEMTFEKTSAYCDTLTLAGYADWRLPTAQELFDINNHNYLNPALDTNYFKKTIAEYWWTSELRCDDATKVWVVNAGGGVGAHPKTETISAGGAKYFHFRAVRAPITTTYSIPHFTDVGDGTIKDNYTGLTWQKNPAPETMTWEAALAYANSSTLAGKSDWRLPNVKELQSLNDVTVAKPSFNKIYFPNVSSGNFWSSTTMYNTAAKAWNINVDYGIVSYDDKTALAGALLVRGGMDNSYLNIFDVKIPTGELAMGDHFGFVDLSHGADETPIHNVKIDSFYISKTLITNQQYLTYLNAALLQDTIEVRNNVVYTKGTADSICYTYQYSPSYSIKYDGKSFSLSDYRANHPVVGVMWYGIIAYCNWLSEQNNLAPCYTLSTQKWDFTKNGYRLPTEAEWEYAARGGHTNPYFNYVLGDSVIQSTANLPESGDPYESGSIPYTTPVGFYDGTLKLKTDFNWPGSAANYQTTNAINGFGLYDMQGNVWEYINDWYTANYYSISPTANPQGPDTGAVMPDGVRYHGMRGGNWYNGLVANGVNNGHSRVSNRNPAYYRGPIAVKDSWSEVGFRIARNCSDIQSGVGSSVTLNAEKFQLWQNYPNPFNPSTTIRYNIPFASHVSVSIYNVWGQELEQLVNGYQLAGMHNLVWNGGRYASGIYFCSIRYGNTQRTIKMTLIK
jgi:formylglycine-generating enzyme required for sulfatase activity